MLLLAVLVSVKSRPLSIVIVSAVLPRHGQPECWLVLALTLCSVLNTYMFVIGHFTVFAGVVFKSILGFYS
ncbi:hypothetical protein PI125_g1305 [Phytophthora idaei]|nr:hypothetical protein PI125_g1305 [Phytophthora idaei]